MVDYHDADFAINDIDFTISSSDDDYDTPMDYDCVTRDFDEVDFDDNYSEVATTDTDIQFE